MSAAISCLTANRLTPAMASSSLARAAALLAPTLLFSSTMTASTQDIARGLQRRDPDLLDHLIELYQYRLFRYLVYITSNKERAEDFFQETWIRVLERGHQYDGKSKFESWLFTIARNLVIDWQRSKKAQSLDSLTDPEQEAPLQVANEKELSPLQQVMIRETTETVHSSLEKIPAIYREVLVLRFQEELQIEEMATVLSINVSTVKSRLYRGLTALRSALPGGAA
jgi:RNA polymerase sigma-70 factor (ECF subfamily)